MIAAKEGATDDDVQERLAHKTPSTRGAKCIVACVGESTGMVSQNSFHCIIWILPNALDTHS